MTNGCIVYTNIQPVVNRVERTATIRSTGCQTGLYNRLTTGCIVSTNIQPVVKRGLSSVSGFVLAIHVSPVRITTAHLPRGRIIAIFYRISRVRNLGRVSLLSRCR